MNPAVDIYADNPRLFLKALTRLYRRAVGFRLDLYRRGLLKTRTLPVRVISVGNLTVGGTGKTPAVMMTARACLNRGLRPVILSRGYRGRSGRITNIVSDGREVRLGPEMAGDEAFLLARQLTGVPVLTGRDRYSLGLRALSLFHPDLFILDDGFQHLALARRDNLLLLDAARPWGNGFLLPAGALREPRSEARRATAFLLTRCTGGEAGLLRELRRDFPHRPIFLSRHRPVRLCSLAGTEVQDPGVLSRRRLLAFCGLARPDFFRKTLLDLGAEVAGFISWPDHHWPGPEDLRLIEDRAVELDVRTVVTTAKDAVKLPGLWPEARSKIEVWVLEIEMEILDGPDEYAAWLVSEWADSVES
ncbi:MAG: tetraacyldisaccharide 4'-kinase [Thermodesulfobacteriota bacterium]